MIMAIEIKSAYLDRQTNYDHFEYISYVVRRIDAVGEAVSTRFPDEVAALKTALQEEDEVIVLSQKSALTDQIAHYDALRDSYVSGYKKFVKSFLSMPEGEELTAAKKLDQHITDFKINTKYALDRETGMLTNFTSDLETKYAAEIELLGATMFANKIKEANEKVRELLEQRDHEKSQYVKGATEAARKKTDEVYEDLVKKINAACILEDETDYSAFIKDVNERIERLNKNSSGSSGDKKPTTDKPENPDGDGTPSGDDQPTTDPDEDDGNDGQPSIVDPGHEDEDDDRPVTDPDEEGEGGTGNDDGEENLPPVQ